MNKNRFHAINKRSGKLLSTDQIRKRAKGGYECFCHCDCGNSTWIRTCDIISKHIKSCGCRRTKIIYEAMRNRILSMYTENAKRRNIKWNLSDKQFDKLIFGNCFYCNSKPNNIQISCNKKNRLLYNGIDRLNNESVYNISNTVSCCIICNRAKNNMLLKDFTKWMRNISKVVQNAKR